MCHRITNSAGPFGLIRRAGFASGITLIPRYDLTSPLCRRIERRIHDFARLHFLNQLVPSQGGFDVNRGSAQDDFITFDLYTWLNAGPCLIFLACFEGRGEYQPLIFFLPPSRPGLFGNLIDILTIIPLLHYIF